MKTYALIKDNTLRRTIAAETKPEIAENKGVWYEVNDEGAPEYNSETQVLEKSGKVYYGKWKIEYTVRDKTALEMWAHPEYAMKVNIPLLRIPDYAGLAMMLEVQGCPKILKSDGSIDVYLNYILPEHLTLILQDQNITITDKPE